MKLFKYSEVLKEIEHLQKHATKDEKERLNLIKFDADHIEKCIYGLMTGNCSSNRAEDLYPKSLYTVTKGLDQKKGVDFTHLEAYIMNNKKGGKLALKAIKHGRKITKKDLKKYPGNRG